MAACKTNASKYAHNLVIFSDDEWQNIVVNLRSIADFEHPIVDSALTQTDTSQAIQNATNQISFMLAFSPVLCKERLRREVTARVQDTGLRVCRNDPVNNVDPSGLTLIALDSLGKNGGQLDISVSGESLCVGGKTGTVIYDLTFITPFYVNKYGREHDGELIIDGTKISVGEPIKTDIIVNKKTILNYKVKHSVTQSECPETEVSGDVDILISWTKTSPDHPNPGTHLVTVKWKYKCKKNTDKNGKKCCAGEATPFTVTIE